MEEAHREIELKLALDARTAASVARHPLLNRLAKAPPVTKTVHSIYFDTQDDDLLRKDAALRLRRVGRTWLQTLKSDGGAVAGLHVRKEIEQRVPAGTLALEQLDDTAIKERLLKWQQAGKLNPRFATVFKRTTWQLQTTDDSLVECALDRGELRSASGQRKQPICELELELLAGQTSALFALARELSQDLELELEDRSKADRGYDLARQRSSVAPLRSEEIDLTGAASAGEAFARILGNGLRHLHGNRRAALVAPRYDAEHAHQMRVALRRLRTAFGVFGQLDESLKSSPLVEEMRWLGQLLGDARDLDVLLMSTLPGVRAAFAEEAFWPELFRRARREQRKARLELKMAIRSRRYFFLVLALGELATNVATHPALAQAIEPFAAQLLSRRRKQLRKRARGLAEQTAEERHAVRIAAKKMRYAAEFFGSLFPGGERNRFLQRFSRLQDCMGELNDIATAQRLVSVLAPQEQADLVYARGVLRGWWQAQEMAVLDQLGGRWKAVKRAKDFWPSATETNQ